jgi:hypothetical protein
MVFKTVTRDDPPANRVTLGPGGGISDPRIFGGGLVVYNSAGSGELDAFTLPNNGWELVGSESAPKAYVYLGRRSGFFEITKVVVKQDMIKIKGFPGIPIDGTPQGSIAVSLLVGASRFCSDAPAKTSGSPPSSANYDNASRFLAAPNSPPPPACVPFP